MAPRPLRRNYSRLPRAHYRLVSLSWDWGPFRSSGQRKVRNEVKQVTRFSLAMLLISFALVATAAPAFAQSGTTFSDPDQRWLLGMGIVALSVIVGLLMAWYLPMGQNSAGFRRWVSHFLRKIRRRHRRRQFNRDGSYGDVAYRSVAPAPDAKKTTVLSPNGVAKAHDLPSDESEGL